MIPSEIWQLIFKINRDKRRRLDFNRAYNEMSKSSISRLTFMNPNNMGEGVWFTVLFMDFSQKTPETKKWSRVSLSTTRLIRDKCEASIRI